MPQRFDTIDLETLNLRPGDGRTIDARLRIDPVTLAGQGYEPVRTADFNPRHAGEDLLATVTVVDVRAPNPDEERRGRV